ncbi:MAG: YciI family protein [Planctomycetota bacterium]|nr:MAG: YciI family protein [Planctomycetota bacterium]
MKYLLLIYMDEQAMDEQEYQACYVESAGVAQQLAEKGQYLSANPLHPVATATSVQVREGRPNVTDGPFAETREQLGGYFLIDAPDLNEAIEVASQLPPAKKGTVEIRPVLEVPGLPEV